MAHAAERPRYSGSIVIATVGDPTQTAGLRALAKAYKQFQPDVDIKIEVTGGSVGGSDNYPTWLSTQLASGKPRPDIVSGNYCVGYAHYVNFDYYRRCVNPYTGNRWDQDLDFDFSVFRTTLGIRSMLPTQAVHIMWFYNVDMFERLGLSPPKTWPEFMDVCAKIQAAGKIPTTLRFDFRYHQWLAEILWDQYSRPHIEHLRAQPGDWCFNPETDGVWKYDPADPFNSALPTLNLMRLERAIHKGIIRYDTPEFVEFLERMKEIARYTPPDFLVEQAGAGADPYSLFVRQDAAIHLDGTWLLPQIDEDMEDLRNHKGGSGPLRAFRWATFEPPSLTGPLVKAPARSIESSAGVYVSIVAKNQPQIDRCVDFVMFWLSAPGHQVFIDGSIAEKEFRPAGKLMVRGVKIPEKYERMNAVYAMIGNAENDVNRLFGLAPQGSRLTQDARQMLVQIIQGRIDCEEGAKRFQAFAEASVEETLRKNGMPMSLLDHPEADPSLYKAE